MDIIGAITLVDITPHATHKGIILNGNRAPITEHATIAKMKKAKLKRLELKIVPRQMAMILYSGDWNNTVLVILENDDFELQLYIILLSRDGS